MGVQADGDVESTAQSVHENSRGCGSQEARHVLDAQSMRAGGHVVVGDAQVVVQRVGRLVRVEDVGRVADGALRIPAVLAHCVDHGPCLLDTVEGVEDAEDVHAGLARLGDERRDHVGRVGA